MKKFAFLVLAALTLTMVSCKDDPETQETPIIDVDTTLLKEVGPAGGNFTIDVTSNEEYEITFSYKGDSKDWLKNAVETRATTTEKLTFTASAWDGAAVREGTITLTGNDVTKDITVRQSPSSASFELSFQAGLEITYDDQWNPTIRVDEYGLRVLMYIDGNNMEVTASVDESTPWVSVVSDPGVYPIQIQVARARTGDLYDYSENRVAVVHIKTADNQQWQDVIIKQDPRTPGVYVTSDDEQDPRTLEQEFATEHEVMLQLVEDVKITGPLTEDELMSIMPTLPNVKKLDLGDAIFTEIPASAFSSANISLEELILPEGLVTVGDKAFYRTTAQTLKKINLPSTLKYIGSQSFSGPLEGTITIPRSVEIIKSSAFSGHNFTEIIFEEAGEEFNKSGARTIIEDTAFLNKSSNASATVGLTSDLVIPNWVSHIGSSAFGLVAWKSGTAIKLTIGKNVVEIKGGAFRNNPWFSEIDIQGTGDIIVVKGTAVASSLFGVDASEDCQLKSFTVPCRLRITADGDYVLPGAMLRGQSALETVVVSEGIKVIQEQAFYGYNNRMANLVNLTLPSTLTAIDANAFNYVTAFEGKTIYLPEGTTVASTAFNNIGTAGVTQSFVATGPFGLGVTRP